MQTGFHFGFGEARFLCFHPFAHNLSKHGVGWVKMGWFWFLGLGVGLVLVLVWRMDLVLSQARWFEIPLLDEGGCQPCFVFPHKRERKTQRFGVEKVVELGDHGVQNLVLHKEDHGFHGRLGEITMVWVVGILVVVVG